MVPLLLGSLFDAHHNSRRAVKGDRSDKAYDFGSPTYQMPGGVIRPIAQLCHRGSDAHARLPFDMRAAVDHPRNCLVGNSGPFALNYNKKIFDQFGLTVPTTWDEYAQDAEKLAKASDGKVKMGHFYPTQAPWFIGLAWASGGRFFKTEGDTWIQMLNNPAAEKVLTYWDGLVKKGYVSTIPGFTAEFYTALGSGQIASSVEAAWGPGVTAASLNDKTAGDWRAALLPQWSKDQTFSSGNWGGSCDVVTKQSKHPVAATLFAVWLNAAKGPVVANWINFGIFPASSSGLATPDLHQPDKNPSKFFGGQNLVELYSDASKAVSVDFAWAPWFAFVNDNFNKQIDALFTGKMTPKQALDAWQNESLKNAKDDGYDVKGQ
jgi:multiple sugar transport system substrate-binding protein